MVRQDAPLIVGEGEARKDLKTLFDALTYTFTLRQTSFRVAGPIRWA